MTTVEKFTQSNMRSKTIPTEGPPSTSKWSVSSIPLLSEGTFVSRWSSLRMQFCKWLQYQHTKNELFLHNILWTDKACFTCDMCSTSTAVTCGHGINPHAIRNHGYHAHFNISIWAEIIGDAAVGPYLLPYRLTAQQHQGCLKICLSQGESCGFSTPELQCTMGKMSSSGLTWHVQEGGLVVTGQLHGLLSHRI
jgi:hypothetical protein